MGPWQAADQSPKTLGGEDTWFIEFAGTQSESAALDRLQSRGISVPAEAVYDFGRHQVLSVSGPAEKFSKNY